MMEIITQADYKSSRGEKMYGKTLTQLAEYQPLQKQLANLTIAGLNSMARQAMEFYDSHKGPDDVDIPLLPRHITPDIVSVHQIAEQFAERKAEIEERVRLAREKQLQAL
jgi:hypothetical protein